MIYLWYIYELGGSLYVRWENECTDWEKTQEQPFTGALRKLCLKKFRTKFIKNVCDGILLWKKENALNKLNHVISHRKLPVLNIQKHFFTQQVKRLLLEGVLQ